MKRAVVFLIVLAVASGCAGGDVASQGDLAVYEEERGVLFVEPERVREFMEAGNDVVFVDNRNAFTFQQSRIAGARLIPTGEMERSIGGLPLNKWIVFYCT
ncbi:MAG TPA: rhodanese-like domain-containing protein [Gemmatimonadota bacterium]|nr:rhodanese-like domain-containing protein [Gemmatimonadota bacterium]